MQKTTGVRTQGASIMEANTKTPGTNSLEYRCVGAGGTGGPRDWHRSSLHAGAEITRGSGTTAKPSCCFSGMARFSRPWVRTWRAPKWEVGDVDGTAPVSLVCTGSQTEPAKKLTQLNDGPDGAGEKKTR